MDTNTELKYTTPVFKKDQPDDSYKFQPHSFGSQA